MHAITIKNLTKYFFHQKGFFNRQKFLAVNKVNLIVDEGEIFGLLGPNGAGKTTLIKMLTLLLSPSEGEATINGFNLKDEEQIRRSIGLIYPGERSFYPRLTARQNLDFFAALHNLPFNLARKRIDELLELVGLKDKADIWFEEYSSGMKQRLAIARGLLNDPKIIFMDEPTKGLDPLEAHRFRKFIKDFLVKDQKKTVFLATHQLDEAKELCNRLAIIHLGEIRLCGKIEDLIGSKGNTLYNVFLEAIGEKKHDLL